MLLINIKIIIHWEGKFRDIKLKKGLEKNDAAEESMGKWPKPRTILQTYFIGSVLPKTFRLS